MKVGRSREVGNFVYQITRQPVFEIFTGRQCDYETMYCFIYDKLLIKKKTFRICNDYWGRKLCSICRLIKINLSGLLENEGGERSEIRWSEADEGGATKRRMNELVIHNFYSAWIE